MNKKLIITLAIIFVVGFIIYRTFVGSYNNMVNREEAVNSSWAQVENVYQRR